MGTKEKKEKGRAGAEAAGFSPGRMSTLSASREAGWVHSSVQASAALKDPRASPQFTKGIARVLPFVSWRHKGQLSSSCNVSLTLISELRV